MSSATTEDGLYGPGVKCYKSRNSDPIGSYQFKINARFSPDRLSSKKILAVCKGRLVLVSGKNGAAALLLSGSQGGSCDQLTEAKKPRHLSLRLGLVRALTVEHWAYLVKMQYQRSLPREFTLLLFVRLAYIERGPGRRFLMIPEGVVKRLERTKKSDVTHERVNE